MDIDIIREKVKDITDAIDKQERSKEIIEQTIENNEEVQKIESFFAEYGRREIIAQFNDLFDTLLIGLVSKKKTFTIFNGDREVEIAVSNSGLGYRKKGWRGQRAKYLPSNWSGNEKFNFYLKILNHADKIIALINKEDKKEILRILQNNLKGLCNNQFIIPTHETQFNEKKEVLIYKKERWSTDKILEQANDCKGIQITNVYKTEIRIKLMDSGEYIHLKPNMNMLTDTLTYLSIITDKEIKEEVDKFIEDYKKVMHEIKAALEKCKEELQPYLVMELL